MNSELMEREQINNLLLQTDEYIRHEYLSVLDQATPIIINDDEINSNCATMQIMHLHSFVMEVMMILHKRYPLYMAQLNKQGILRH